MDQFGLSIIQDEEALKNSLIFILCFRAFVAVFFARTREKINRLWTGLSNRAARLTKVQFLKRGNCGDKNGFISNFSNAICFLLSTQNRRCIKFCSKELKDLRENCYKINEYFLTLCTNKKFLNICQKSYQQLQKTK